MDKASVDADAIVVKKKEQQLRIAGIAIIVLLLFNFVSTCSSSSKIKTLTKQVKVLDSAVVKLENKPVTVVTDAQLRDAVKDECMEAMYKYLIYEADLDKGKTSLSQIRSDIDRIKAEK